MRAIPVPIGFVTALIERWLLSFHEIDQIPKRDINDPKSLDYLTQTYAREITIAFLIGAPGAGLLDQFLVFRISLERRITFTSLRA